MPWLVIALYMVHGLSAASSHRTACTGSRHSPLGRGVTAQAVGGDPADLGTGAAGESELSTG